MTLAPMAGVGNRVFRLLCARLGARLVGGEFVNSRSLSGSLRGLRHLLDFSDAEVYRATGMSVLAAQIYGNDPGSIAEGARLLEERGAQIVDLNFGCAIPRIVRRGAGAAYLRDPGRLGEAVRRTVDSVKVPVTVKTRLGWDEDSINILEVVRRVQDAGARCIAIHARTVLQRSGGKADWSWIGRAKEIASIPVLGNGDVRSVGDAAAMQRTTGCDGVMIGRAAVGRPWIFSGRSSVSLEERIDLAIAQLRAMVAFKGERIGLRETRKHLDLYFDHLPRRSRMRRRLLTAGSLSELIDLLRSWRETAAGEGDGEREGAGPLVFPPEDAPRRAGFS